ncbi:TonB-dependent receptor [Sphingomonas sp. PB4P5]|uniref:TonB-dependent receptor n=1 Tax=Parasphingomonas puruogangriensis TaxID=3096155 RepID=UPI002FC979F3
MKNFGHTILFGTTCLVAPYANAQQIAARDYDIASQDLGTAINVLAAASGQQIIVADSLVEGRRSGPVRGKYTAETALREMLRGSGLRASLVGTTFVVRPEGVTEPGELAPDIVVTGTRIRGSAPVGSAVISIDRKAIDDSGYATIAQVLQSIPQNFGGGPSEAATGPTLNGTAGLNTASGSSINLRGLGTGSTLVLLNGDRPALGGPTGVFADISMIPNVAIERIEVVPDGASAIYGSDAVAGVVNLIPRLAFNGAESSFRIGTADGDYEEYGFSQLLGTRWSSGRVMLAYEFYRRDRLPATDRDFATDDLTRFGGPDRRGTFSNPGTIVTGGTTFAVPRGQNGTELTAAMLTPGTANRGDAWLGTDLLPMQRRHSVFASLSQHVSGDLKFYAHGLATLRNFDLHVRPSGDATRTVPTTNPYYVDPLGTHLPIGVQYSFVRDLGPEGSRGKAHAYGATAGFALDLDRWAIDAHGTWGRQYERSTSYNRVNTIRLAAALADTNPATAYNLLGDGVFTNLATIDRVRGSLTTGNTGIVWSATLRANGPLFSLPAGTVQLAVGSEYRKEYYRITPTINDVTRATPTELAGIALPAPRTVRAAYVELLVPVFGVSNGLPVFRRLDVSAAVRTERYSDFGTTTNPKLGLNWTAVKGLTFRGSYGKSFRAPGFNDLRQDPGAQLVFAYPLPDPASPTGTTNVIVIRGNDPALRPERAKTITFGADITPSGISGFRASATWFDIDYRDRISSPANQLLSFLTDRATYAPVIADKPTAARIAELYADPFFINPFGIAPSTIRAVADARLQNLAVVRQSGADLDLAYAFDLGKGRADVGASGTYLFHIRQALSATAEPVDVVDTLGSPADLRMRGHVGWTSGRFRGVLTANYVDSYTNRTTATPEKVTSWTTLDLQLNYAVPADAGALGGLRIALSATNLFDRDPPYAAYLVGPYTYGYDPENANPAGRVFSLQVSRKW